MWIQRDFSHFLRQLNTHQHLPVKVLKGPRQVGKTSILEHLSTHELVLFDDLGVRNLAQENPSLFFKQFSKKIILDEATLAPEIFPEIKKMVDAERRLLRTGKSKPELDIWITGSNQTLLQKSIRESLAGRASYFSLNTLSIHELSALKPFDLGSLLIQGGWPELHVSPDLNTTQYLNDFISTFIEKDIVIAAGIEKRAAFAKMLQLCAARTGQLINYSDIAQNIGVDVTTVQSWISLLEQNAVVRVIQPYYNNLNQRLIKTPKFYFEDSALAVRLQGWTDFRPLLLSPYFGSLIKNLALTEISRFFTNQTINPEIYVVRSKEKVEIDFLIKLPNDLYVAAEVKSTGVDMTSAQLKLLDSLQLNIIEKWILSPVQTLNFTYAKSISFDKIYEHLERVMLDPGHLLTNPLEN